MLKFHYYPETDSLYIELSEKSSVKAQEVADGVVLDFDSDGYVIGIDLDHASKFVNLSRLETNSVPFHGITAS